MATWTGKIAGDWYMPDSSTAGQMTTTMMTGWGVAEVSGVEVSRRSSLRQEIVESPCFVPTIMASGTIQSQGVVESR